MLDSKFIITVIALAGVAIVIYLFTKKSGHENFGLVRKITNEHRELAPTQVESGIKYNMAVPYEPLTFGNMVRENFSTTNSGCSTQMTSDKEYPDATDMMPIGDMTGSQPAVIYDRIIFANKNSRLRSQGDPIRGDLRIPRSNLHSGWFQTSATVNDLHPGAMNVLAGTNC